MRTLAYLLFSSFSVVAAIPYGPGELQQRVTFDFAADSGIHLSSTFNPRFFDSDVYVNQINPGSQGFARYPSGQNIPTLIVDNHETADSEHRMIAPFRGVFRARYLLGSSSGQVSFGTFSRYTFDGKSRIQVPTPGPQPGKVRAEGWDWVDDDTIIYTDYASGGRNRLHLADVSADPFCVSLNTTWNANGYVPTSADTRIRNVRVGDFYPGHAYFGDAGNNDDPRFYVLELATGEVVLLGSAGYLTGTGSYGVWTVLERGGYLYVQTTDNGIQVYPMTSATSVGPLYAIYSKADLDLVSGYSGQYYGLDVTPGGRCLVLGSGAGKVFELGPPDLGISWMGTYLLLSWPVSVTEVVVQSSLSAELFNDLEPQPPVQVEGKANTAFIVPQSDRTFYRLRKRP